MAKRTPAALRLPARARHEREHDREPRDDGQHGRVSEVRHRQTRRERRDPGHGETESRLREPPGRHADRDEEERTRRDPDSELPEEIPAPLVPGVDGIGRMILEGGEQGDEGRDAEPGDRRPGDAPGGAGEAVEHEQRRADVEQRHRDDAEGQQDDEGDGDTAAGGGEMGCEARLDSFHAYSPPRLGRSCAAWASSVARMKASRSPSSTLSTLPISRSVRWSFARCCGWSV